MSFLSSNLFAAAAEGAGKMLLDQYHNRQQWIYDKKAMDYSYNQQLDFWNKTNDYNSPVSQMQRLEEAGLNPNLVYGSGGATHQATMPTASASRGRVHASSINPLIGQQMENMEAEEGLIKAQARGAVEIARKNKAEADIAKNRSKVIEKTGVDPNGSGPLSWMASPAVWIANKYEALEDVVEKGLRYMFK